MSLCLKTALLPICLALMLNTSLSMAQEPNIESAASPTFGVVNYLVEGNTLLKFDDISQLLRPYTGANRSFGDVQQALEALQSAYQKIGYGSVQVVLPEQELNKGVVTFKVIEQKLNTVKVEGNQFHDDANIINSVPSLKVGEITSTAKVAANLRVANENPSKQTSVLFKSTEGIENAVDAVLKVTDENPSKIFLTADNTGNPQTGRARVGVGYQHYNLFNHDDRFSSQVVTSPESFFEDVRILGFGYSRPLYEWGDSIDLMAGYSDVDSGSVLSGALDIASKGLVFGAKYNFNLKKIGDYEHKLVFGLDYKQFRPDINTQDGENQTPYASTTPLSISYVAAWQKPTWQLSYNVGAAYNLAIGKNGGSDSLGEANDVAFPWLSDTYFTKFLFGADYSRKVFDTWVMHLGVDGQFTDDHLHPGEQYGIGGMDSVRGWYERSFAADRGYRMTADMTSPDFGHRLSDKMSMRGVFFIDRGFVSNNKDILLNEPGSNIDIASIGAGLRFNYSKKLIGRLDYAYAIDGDKTNDPNATHAQQNRAGDLFGHFSLVWVW